MRLFKASALLASLAAPALASAHDGHSHYPAYELIHYLMTPEHCLPILALALTTAAVLIWRRRTAEQRIKR